MPPMFMASLFFHPSRRHVILVLFALQFLLYRLSLLPNNRQSSHHLLFFMFVYRYSPIALLPRDPTRAQVASRFLGYDQQDAQEFLRFLLDAIHEDTNRVLSPPPYEELKESQTDSNLKVRLARACHAPQCTLRVISQLSLMWWKNYSARNNSFIKDLFCGQLRTSVRCNRCGFTSRCFDPFWDLSVRMHVSFSSSHAISVSSDGVYSVGDRFQFRRVGSSEAPAPSKSVCRCVRVFRSQGLVMLVLVSVCACQAFVTPERLSGTECWYCSKCKRATDAEKVMHIFRCPVVLVIHLKRFSFSSFRRTKLTTAVKAPLRGFSLDDYIHEDCALDLCV